MRVIGGHTSSCSTFFAVPAEFIEVRRIVLNRANGCGRKARIVEAPRILSKMISIEQADKPLPHIKRARFRRVPGWSQLLPGAPSSAPLIAVSLQGDSQRASDKPIQYFRKLLLRIRLRYDRVRPS